MDIQKLLKQIKIHVSEPQKEDLDNINQTAFLYEAKTPAPISLEPFMDEYDFKSIERDYSMDEELWFDQFTDEIKVELQRSFNILNKENENENFLGYTVGRVNTSGQTVKEMSIFFDIKAFYEIPLQDITDSLKKGLEMTGKT